MERQGQGKEPRPWPAETQAPAQGRPRSLSGGLQMVRQAVQEQQQLAAVSRLLAPALEIASPWAGVGLLFPPTAPTPAYPAPLYMAPAWMPTPEPAAPPPAAAPTPAQSDESLLGRIRALLQGAPAQRVEEACRAAPPTPTGDLGKDVADTLR